MQGQIWGTEQVSVEWYSDALGGGWGAKRAGAFCRAREEVVLVKARKLEVVILDLLLALFTLVAALSGAALSLLAGKLRHNVVKSQSVGMLQSNPKPGPAEHHLKPWDLGFAWLPKAAGPGCQAIWF